MSTESAPVVATSPAQDAPNKSTRTSTPFECIDRISKLPIVEAAIAQSTGIYERVKGINGLVYWTLSTAEGAAKMALSIAIPFTIPLVLPIYVVDLTLCKGLDVVENRLPIIKEQPQQIFDVAKNYGTNKAQSLAELSRQKANEVLTTRLIGRLAYTGFDSTAHFAERYFDYYFPPIETEQQEPVPEEDPNDRVSHTIHTVGRISHKVAHRVYVSASARVKSLDMALDDYFNALKHARNKLSAKDGASQEPASVDGASQEPASVDGASQEPASVDGTSQEPASVDGTSQEPTSVDMASHEPTSVDGTSKEPTSVDGTSKEPTSVDGTSKEPTSVDGTSQEPTSVDGTSQEPTSVDGTSQEPAPVDGTSQEPAPVDGTSQEPAPADGTSQEPAPVDVTSQEPASVDGTSQGPAPVEGITATEQATSADSNQF